MIATLIGSTGLTGSFLVGHLLADPAITRVISISRKSLNISDSKLTEVLLPHVLPTLAPSPESGEAHSVPGSSGRPSHFDGDPRQSAFRFSLAELPSLESKLRADLYFCCLGTTIKAASTKENFEKVDRDAVVAFAKIAQAHDATSFALVSAMGANASSIFFYNQVKGQTENDVQALGLRSLIIFRPALLVGSRREFRLAEKIAAKTVVPLSHLLPARTRKSLITDAATLARRMLAEAKAAPPGVHIIKAKDI
jgi:hypothetical protein